MSFTLTSASDVSIWQIQSKTFKFWYWSTFLHQSYYSGKKIVAKFNCSTNATPRLIELSKKSSLETFPHDGFLLSFFWKRLLELRDLVTYCLWGTQQGWVVKHWMDSIKKILNLLEPFASYTQLRSAEKTVTFSEIVSCIDELRLRFEKV